MEFFRNWPLQHYVTLRGVATTTKVKLYYNADEDTFVVPGEFDSKLRISETYYIVGKTSTLNAVYTALNAKQIPKIPENIATIIARHRDEDPVIRKLSGISAAKSTSPSSPKQPNTVQPTSQFVLPIEINIAKINNTLASLSIGECVNILSGSKIKNTTATTYVDNKSSEIPLCYPKSKVSASIVAQSDKIFAYVEDAIRKLRNSTPIPNVQPTLTQATVLETEANKIDRLNSLKPTIPSPKKVSPRRNTTTSTSLPRISTLDLDREARNIPELRIASEESQNKPDIVNRINASENRVRSRVFPKNERPEALEDIVNEYEDVLPQRMSNRPASPQPMTYYPETQEDESEFLERSTELAEDEYSSYDESQEM